MSSTNFGFNTHLRICHAALLVLVIYYEKGEFFLVNGRGPILLF